MKASEVKPPREFELKLNETELRAILSGLRCVGKKDSKSMHREVASDIITPIVELI